MKRAASIGPTVLYVHPELVAGLIGNAVLVALQVRIVDVIVLKSHRSYRVVVSVLAERYCVSVKIAYRAESETAGCRTASEGLQSPLSLC